MDGCGKPALGSLSTAPAGQVCLQCDRGKQRRSVERRRRPACDNGRTAVLADVVVYVTLSRSSSGGGRVCLPKANTQTGARPCRPGDLLTPVDPVTRR